MAAAATAARREALHRRGVRLEVCTVAWNAVEGVVAISAGIATASSAGREMGSEVLKADAVETWVCLLPLARAARRGGAQRRLRLVVGRPAGELAMLPVILWQGFVTLGEAREGGEDTK